MPAPRSAPPSLDVAELGTPPGPSMDDPAYRAEIGERLARVYRGESEGRPWAEIRARVLADIQRR